MFDQKFPILLASGSPRRREYLERFGLQFDVASTDIDESVRASEEPIAYVRRMVEEKAQAFLSDATQDTVVLTADTLVLIDGQILGKPEGQTKVLPMLEQLNGKMHQVITGYGVFFEGKKHLREVVSQVWFRQNPKDLLAAYAKTDEPLDKAGSYSIQGLGTLLVEKIDGSYNNVVGLPVEELLADLVNMHLLTPKV